MAAKLKERAMGRPALLDAPKPLTRIWLIATQPTKVGTTKPPIVVRVTEESFTEQSECWRGWPLKGRYRFRPWEWAKTEWRCATDAESLELDKKPDTIPAPPPRPMVNPLGPTVPAAAPTDTPPLVNGKGHDRKSSDQQLTPPAAP